MKRLCALNDEDLRRVITFNVSASILTPIDSDLYRATDITILHVPMCFSLCSLLPIRCNRTGCCYFFFCAYEINYGTNRLPPTCSPPGGKKSNRRHAGRSEMRQIKRPRSTFFVTISCEASRCGPTVRVRREKRAGDGC